jgi:hypothetical protein
MPEVKTSYIVSDYAEFELRPVENFLIYCSCFHDSVEDAQKFSDELRTRYPGISDLKIFKITVEELKQPAGEEARTCLS